MISAPELPSSPVGMSRPELAGMLRAAYPDASPNTIANNTGQVWHFVNTIALGDLVVVPLKGSRSFRVGRVVGPAEHRDDLAELAAARPVEWEVREVASQSLAVDLRHALGSIMTVFRPRAQAAERRLESVLKDGRDPGPDSGGDDRSGAWVFQAKHGGRPGAAGPQVVHVRGCAHAAVRAPAGFHVLRMPEPVPGIRTVFWQQPARVRGKRPSRSRSVIDLRQARARVTTDMLGNLVIGPQSLALPELGDMHGICTLLIDTIPAFYLGNSTFALS